MKFIKEDEGQYQIPWEGDKAAVRYLLAHDPAYLSLYQQFTGEVDRLRKMDLYTQLAELATTPAGGLWPAGITAIQTGSGAEIQPDMVGKGIAFWEDLIASNPEALS